MANIEEAKAQKKNATDIREQESEDYKTEHKDLDESVDALGRAIKQLKKRSDRAEDKSTDKHAATNEEAQEDFDKNLPKLLRTKPWQRTMSLIQLSDSDTGAKVSAWAEELSQSLDSQGLEQLPTPAKADNYEFQSGGIIDMLKKLQKQFIKEKRDLEEEEAKKKAASALLVQSLEIEIEKQTVAKSKKDSFHGSAMQNKVEAQASLDETKTSRAKDQEYLNDLQAECKLKTDDFKERQRVRTLEVEAVVKAAGILKEVAFVQRSSSAGTGTALAALRANAVKPAEEKAIQFLQAKAKELRSRTLDRFLQRVTAPHNMMAVMQDIGKMLHEMVTKLQEEGLKETEHKAWCDKEVSQNKQSRSEKTEDADFATSEVDLLTTSIQTLTEENMELADEIAKLEAAMKEATATRKNESATNEKILKENFKAHAAVKQAISVLKEFYVTGDGAASFLQRQKPEFAAGDYADTGQSNVIRLLDVISQDLTAEETETKASEEASLNEFRDFMAETRATKSEKASMKQRKEMKKANQAQTLVNRKNDLQQLNEELDALNDYYKTLEPKCIKTDMSYAEEVKRRGETLEALQDAYEMLNQYD